MSHENVIVPKYILELVRFEGYLQRFNVLLSNHTSKMEAWRTLEAEYETWYGVNKYSCYQSFQKQTREFLKKRARKHKNK